MIVNSLLNKVLSVIKNESVDSKKNLVKTLKQIECLRPASFLYLGITTKPSWIWVYLHLPATPEAEFRKGVGSVPAAGNCPLIGG